MTQDLINRYQQGGDIYSSIQAQYGQAAADQIAAAALSGDETQINSALTSVKYGAAKDTATTSILLDQLYNAPLQAPLEQAGTVLSNTEIAAGDAMKKVTSSALGNWGNWVIGALVLSGLFFYFGGASAVRRHVKSL